MHQVLKELEIKVDSLETIITDNVSKSVKQQLALAQALLGHPKVLVLDEATSALEDDRLVIAKLFKLCRKAKITLINVVHRLSHITEYDRVLVMGDGRILEDGKPAELLKKPMGFFSTLYRHSL